jgi:hypothetical protein
MDKSGQISLDGDVIRYRSTVYGSWDLPVAEVRIVGEATNQSGPFADDYFLCFATGPGMWLEASYYAKGCDEFLRVLAARLGGPLEVGLCHSTDFASRVLWPPSLAGQPMFRYDDVPPKGLLGKVLGPRQNRQTYTEQIAAALGDAAGRASK